MIAPHIRFRLLLAKRRKIIKKVCYTAIIGDYDKLHDPLIVTPGWDYICFTDDKDIKSNVWEIKHIEKDPDLCNRRNSYKFKYIQCPYIKSYDYSIWLI